MAIIHSGKTNSGSFDVALYREHHRLLSILWRQAKYVPYTTDFCTTVITFARLDLKLLRETPRCSETDCGILLRLPALIV